MIFVHELAVHEHLIISCMKAKFSGKVHHLFNRYLFLYCFLELTILIEKSTHNPSPKSVVLESVVKPSIGCLLKCSTARLKACFDRIQEPQTLGANWLRVYK